MALKDEVEGPGGGAGGGKSEAAVCVELVTFSH